MALWRIPICFKREAANLDEARDHARSMIEDWNKAYGWEMEVGEPEEIKPILDPLSSEFQRGYNEILNTVEDQSMQDRIRFAQAYIVANPSTQYEYGKASAINEIMRDARRAFNPAPHIKANPDGEGW